MSPVPDRGGQKGWVRALVRDVLGCRCPEDVFEDVECRENPGFLCGTPLRYKISVGGRLLIYVLEANATLDVIKALPSVIDDGTAERDRRGFNRFRLVVASDDADRVRTVLGGVKTPDDRVHLHAVEKGGIS